MEEDLVVQVVLVVPEDLEEVAVVTDQLEELEVMESLDKEILVEEHNHKMIIRAEEEEVPGCRDFPHEDRIPIQVAMVAMD